MDLNAPIDLTIGPYETYEDEMFGYSRFEGYVTLRDEAESRSSSGLAGTCRNWKIIRDGRPVSQSEARLAAPIRVVNEVQCW